MSLASATLCKPFKILYIDVGDVRGETSVCELFSSIGQRDGWTMVIRCDWSSTYRNRNVLMRAYYFCYLTGCDPAGDNKRRMKLGRALLLLWAIGLTYGAQAKQLAVITDTGNSTTNVTASELVKIFNGHTQNWPDGKAIKIVLRDPSSADMQVAVRKLFNMTADQARAFVRAHSDVMVVADSDDAVIHFVSSTRGAIGLVDLYSLTKGVNVLKVDGRLPVEQGYLLRGN